MSRNAGVNWNASIFLFVMFLLAWFGRDGVQ